MALLLGLEIGPGGIGYQAHAAAVWSKAAVGVVDPQVQAEFGARSEHAVGLVGALADQVVDQDRGVGLGAIEDQRRFILAPASAALMPAIRPWQAASS